MKNKPTHFDDKLSELHASYLGKLENIADILHKYCSNTQTLSQPITDDIIHHIHGIAGSATIFGYPELCKKAQKLDCDLSKKPTLNNSIITEIKNLSALCRMIAHENKTFIPPQIDTHTNIRNNLNILLIEDDQFQQILIQDILETYGYTVQVSENGKKALECLHNNHFDLILCDCMMPVMNGYEFSRLLRKNEILSQSPHIIIALTGNTNAEEINQCLTSGMNDYICKSDIEKKLIPIIEKYTCILERNC